MLANAEKSTDDKDHVGRYVLGAGVPAGLRRVGSNDECPYE